MPQQFNNPANPEVHRRTTGPELIAQLGNRSPDAFVAGVGTGGTITGVGEILRDMYPDVHIIAVEPAKSAVLSGGPPGRTGSRASAPASCRPSSTDRVLSEVRKISDRDAYETKVKLAQHEGLLVGISSGASEDRAPGGRSSAPARASSPSCATPASATSRSTSTLSEAAGNELRARCLVLGAGGLGCPAPLALGAAASRASASSTTIASSCRTCIGRSCSHEDVGRPKVEAFARAVRRRFPAVRVTPHAARRGRQRAGARARLRRRRRRHRLVRRQVPDQRRLRARGEPLVHGGAVALRGQILTVPGAKTASSSARRLRKTLLPLPVRGAAARGRGPSCEEAGILGPFPASSAPCWPTRRPPGQRRNSRFRRAIGPV